MTGAVETALRARIDAGGKCLVPYITGGLGDDWLDTVRAVAAAGADVIEIGMPFSDPVMDGPTIQEANDRALEAGVTPQTILDDLRHADIGVPTAVMTYGNIAHHMGFERFANSLVAAGVSGCILPDIPLEEVGEWASAADEAGVETVMLAAPTAPDERLSLIVERARGFVIAPDPRLSRGHYASFDARPIASRSWSCAARRSWESTRDLLGLRAFWRAFFSLPE